MAAAAMSYVHADVENLKATELRLGLPGAEETDKMPTPPSTPRAGSKRALAGDHSEDEPSEPPAAKAQVVGWPPVRSYRKSCFQQASSKSKAAVPVTEKKQEEIAVAVAAQAAAAGSGGSLFVKVSMDGAPYLRKIDLKMYKGYRELRETLEAMFLGFSGDGATASVNPSDFAVTYEDKDGDLMLVGDVPFEMFMSTCKRMRIMKGSEARGLGSSKE